MKRFTLIISSLLILSSCNETYRDIQKIDDLKWFREDTKIFEVTIPDDGLYDLYFVFRHSSGYPFTSIKIKLDQTGPEGNQISQDAEFQVADENGEYIGEVAGQLWDIKELFSEKKELKKGKYTFKISHAMNSDPVILVIDIGLIIKESD
jgi:gliding motility-associated lipoprotein GldH